MLELQERLRRAGLTGNEAKVYMELLRKGQLSANRLAKDIGMDRTLAYTVLNNMIEKGFVSYILKDNKRYFKSSNPESLLNKVKEQEAFILDLIPVLRSIRKVKEDLPEVNIYEGYEALKTYLRGFIEHKTSYAFGATGRAYDLVYEAPRIAKEIFSKKHEHKAKLIASPKFRDHPMTKLKGVETRYLNIESEVTTNIYGDNVSISFLKHKKPFVIVIKSKDIANGYKNYFKFLWKSAKTK